MISTHFASLIGVSMIAFIFSTFAEPSGKVKSDGEIARVLTTLNEGEIAAAKTALKEGKSAAAKSFATMMNDAYNENLIVTKAMAKKQKVELKDSELSKSLHKEAQALNDSLKKTPAVNFDKAYIDSQVKMHKTALKLIDEKLLPTVYNPALKAHIEKTRADVAEHLQQAENLIAKSETVGGM